MIVPDTVLWSLSTWFLSLNVIKVLRRTFTLRWEILPLHCSLAAVVGEGRNKRIIYIGKLCLRFWWFILCIARLASNKSSFKVSEVVWTGGRGLEDGEKAQRIESDRQTYSVKRSDVLLALNFRNLRMRCASFQIAICYSASSLTPTKIPSSVCIYT